MTGEMIKRVNIRGYKSLKEINVELRPLNILIGLNNSGKTNFIDFFRLLSEGAAGKLEEGFVIRGGFDSILYAKSTDKRITWEIDFLNIDESDSVLFYEVELAKKGYSPIVVKEELYKKVKKDYFLLKSIGLEGERLPLITASPERIRLRRATSTATAESFPVDYDQLKNNQLIIAQVSDPLGYPSPFKLQEYLKSWSFYGEFPTDSDSSLRKAQPLRAGLRVSPNGNNLFSILHYMKEQSQYRDTYNEIVKTLKEAFPTLEDLHFPPEAGEGKIALAWEGIEFKRDFPSYTLSDGVLKFLCLTTLLLSPDPPKLICIDEPEIGLHPKAIDLVGELLIAAAQKTQLIVATHSPQILRKLKPEDILIVEKKDGASELQRLSFEELQSWLKDFTLAELWLTGVIGGR